MQDYMFQYLLVNKDTQKLSVLFFFNCGKCFM